MSYQLERDEPLLDGLCRVAGEQIDKALDEISSSDVGPHETVHQVRKRAKKVRALVRLVRPGFEDTYQRENATLRDAARTLSHLRDATAHLETVDLLAERFPELLDEASSDGDDGAIEAGGERLAALRRELAARREGVLEEIDLEARLEAFADSMTTVRHRLDSWSLDGDPVDALAAGLTKTYRRGRRAMGKAYAATDGDADDSLAPGEVAERFHEWRKRVKYHWYHLRLVVGSWEPVLTPRREEAHRLANLLGDEHDLAVLRSALTAEPGRFGGAEALQPLLGLVDRRRRELQEASRPLGRRLHAETPDALASRLVTYWRAWKDDPPARAALDHRPVE